VTPGQISRGGHHGPTCICYTCRRRRAKLAREALIERRILVASVEAAEHIDSLLAAGWKRIEIARAAGVSPALITKASRPGNGLNESTAAAILAVDRAVEVA
jgi:hypothetical protein